MQPHDHAQHANERETGHHGHAHGAGHSHAPSTFGRAFAIGIALNLAYVAGEAFYGITANSLALLADAGHNLGDVLGLVAAWVASMLSRRLPSSRYTYGLRRASILAALANAVLLLIVTGAVAWEAVRRFSEPAVPAGQTIMIVAAIGILVNGITALLFMSGRKGDLNIKGAFLHMASDALVSAGTVGAGALIFWTGKAWIDPAISLVVSAIIVWGTWSLLRDSLDLALDAIPRGIEGGEVEAYLRALPGVDEVHDLHIWGLSTTDTALTAHLVCKGDGQALIRQIRQDARDRFGIGHVTIQIEDRALAEACELRSAHVV